MNDSFIRERETERQRQRETERIKREPCKDKKRVKH